MYLRQRLSDGWVNKTVWKPRLATAPGRQYIYVGFSRRKIPRSSAYTISEKAIRFRHPDYPGRAQKLISSSMSRHLSTRNIWSKSMHAFLSNLAILLTDRQTDRQTNKHGKRTYTSSFVGSTKVWQAPQWRRFTTSRRIKLCAYDELNMLRLSLRMAVTLVKIAFVGSELCMTVF